VRVPARALVLVCLAAACHGPDAQARAEAARLRREIAALRAAIAVRGSLFPQDRLTIGVQQEFVRDLLRAQLPLDSTILDRFRLRLTDADVRFERAVSLVRLEGRAHLVDAPERFAEVAVTGDLHDVQMDERTGLITGRVAFDHIELRRVTSEAMEPGMARTLVEALAGRGLGAIGEVVAPIEIPTHVDREIVSGGFDDGRIFVAPARMPLHVAVDRALPLGGRLWITLTIEAVR